MVPSPGWVHWRQSPPGGLRGGVGSAVCGGAGSHRIKRIYGGDKAQRRASLGNRAAHNSGLRGEFGRS